MHAQTMFTKILVGLDGSERQPEVLRQAVELADRCGGNLVLCRAVQIPNSIPALAWSLQGNEFEDFLVEHARGQVLRVAETLPKGLVSDVVTELGQPADILLRATKERRCDLVVIGSHGYSGLDRLLGTTAGKVVNKCETTVMVVRNNQPGS
jgi:nucleotide-binding universal stress UspA family protein